METNLMRRVYINGKKENLPKEDEGYQTDHSIILNKERFINSPVFIKDWLKNINWYLAPVSRKEIIEVLKRYSSYQGLADYRYVGESQFEKIADEIIGGK